MAVHRVHATGGFGRPLYVSWTGLTWISRDGARVPSRISSASTTLAKSSAKNVLSIIGQQVSVDVDLRNEKITVKAADVVRKTAGRCRLPCSR